ncbi:MAG: hypothetical protein ACE5QF_08285 [Thermoplasmata archaeon]
MKEELDRLAEASNECVEGDESSLDEHLVRCPECSEYAKKAE